MAAALVALAGFAVPASALAAAPPLATGPLTVQIGPGEEASQTIAIVGVTVADSVKLPVRVRLPVPVGATVQWAGQILGGDPDNDPQQAVLLATGAGGARYDEITLTKSHIGQIDTNLGPLTLSGDSVSAQVAFVQSVPSTSTVFSVRLPAGVSNVAISPAPAGAPEVNSSGESLYVLGTAPLATGAKLSVGVSYSTAAASGAAGSGGSGGSSSTPVIIVLIVALAAVLISLVFVLQRSAQPVAGGDDVDDDHAYDDDEVDDEADAEEADAAGEAEAAGSDDPFDSIDLD